MAEQLTADSPVIKQDLGTMKPGTMKFKDETRGINLDLPPDQQKKQVTSEETSTEAKSEETKTEEAKAEETSSQESKSEETNKKEENKQPLSEETKTASEGTKAEETKSEKDVQQENDGGVQATEKENDDKSKEIDSGSKDDVKTQVNEVEILNSAISKNFDGKFKTLEEVNSHIESLTKTQRTAQDDVDDDDWNKFKEFRKSASGDTNTVLQLFLNTQLQDFTEMSDEDVLHYQSWLKHPDREESDVSFQIENKYNQNEEKHEEEAIKLGKMNMQDDADVARKELIEMQKKAALQDKPEVVDLAKENERIVEHNKEWDQQVDTSLEDFGSVDLVVDDEGGTLEFSVEDKGGVEGALRKLNSFFADRYITTDDKGEETRHITKLRNDLYEFLNKDKIYRSIHNNAVSQTTEKFMENRKNPELKDTTGGEGAVATEKLTETEKIGKGLAGAKRAKV